MPLKKGKKNVGKNIEELLRSGRTRDRAVAIAMSYAGQRKQPKKKGTKKK